jgi:tetratricopeptide (TPR) repeat protein
VALAALGRYEEAYDNFYRATWSSDWSAAAYFNLARLELRRGRWREAIEKLGEAASRNGEFADIPALEAAAWRRAGDSSRALAAAERALALDAMHFMGGYEKSLARAEFEKEWAAVMRGEPQNYLELATAYGAAGLYADAETLLARAPAHTMSSYLRAYFQGLAGHLAAAGRLFSEAAQGAVNHVNPHRLEELAALEAALRHSGRDARAHLFLGNLLYSKYRREEALSHWQQAAAIDPTLWQAWRNVAYAQRYLKKDLAAARQTLQKALAVNPQDARALLELDQVSEALRLAPAERLAVMSRHLDTVRQRDDLTARLADLRLKAGDPENLKLAHASLRTHHFHSWEGRYGIHESWVEVNQRLGDLAYERRDFAAALDHYQQACEYPKNLEVAPRTPDLRAHVYWNLAKVHLAAGRKDAAAGYLDKILAEKYGRAHLGSFYQALAEKARGNEARHRALLEQLAQRARELTSGKFEYRGNQQAIGHYLLARVLEERGAPEAAAEREKALALSLETPRLALRDAQLDYARAHQ